MPGRGLRPAGTRSPARQVAETRGWRSNAQILPMPESAPLAVVLIDAAENPAAAETGQHSLEAEAAILALPGPVTIALDPFDSDAPRRAIAYRAAGHEIMLLTRAVPELATHSDIEVLFETWMRDFPQAMGMIDPNAGDARRARVLAPVLIPALAVHDLALVAVDRGLSPLLQGARTAGVARGGIWRSIDAAGEAGPALRRHLERAAFEAERGGGVMVLGRADRPETMAAIAAWAAQTETVVTVGTLLDAVN